ANVGRPQVAYRESITRKIKAQGRYVKQSGGKGQYGDVTAEFEPLARGGGFEFEWGIKGTALSKEWAKAIQQGMREAMENGVIAANVPLATMFGYATDLRSKTQGRGSYSMEPAYYEVLPPNLAAEITKNK